MFNSDILINMFNSIIPTLNVLIAAIAATIAIIAFIWKTNQSRKNDIKDLFSRKADAKLVQLEFSKHEEMIISEREKLKLHDEKNNLQFKSMEKQMELVNVSLLRSEDKVEAVRKEISEKLDKLQDTIINLANTGNYGK